MRLSSLSVWLPRAASSPRASPCDNLNAAITRVVRSRVAVNRLGKFVRDTPHFVQRRRELIDKSACDFFFAKSPATICPRPPPTAPAYAETLPHPEWPRALPPRPETARQIPPASRPLPHPSARRSAPPPAYFQKHLRGREVFKLQEKSPPPFQSLFFGTSPHDFAAPGITP